MNFEGIKIAHSSFRKFDFSKFLLCLYLNEMHLSALSESRRQTPEHICSWPEPANIQLYVRLSERLSAFVGFSGSFRTGWPSCDKLFTFGGSQKAAEAAGKSNQSLSTCLQHTLSSELPIHSWTEIICLFCFLSCHKLLPHKLILMPRGWMENWVKITFFHKIQPSASLMNGKTR